MDSGNLAGLLLTVAQACRALARAGTDGSSGQAPLLVLAVNADSNLTHFPAKSPQ